jgi:hypothetical protein
MHLRGPINVSQIAVYTLSDAASVVRRREPSFSHDRQKLPFEALKASRRRTSNLPSVQHNDAPTGRELNITCSNWSSHNPDAEHAAESSMSCHTSAALVTTHTTTTTIFDTSNCGTSCLHTITSPRNTFTMSSPAPSTLLTVAVQSKPTTTTVPELEATVAAAAWERVAYYTSTAPAEATGFAFLANLGDEQKSGTFDYSFGNSLSYVTEDGRRVASKTTPFDGTLETSEIEISAFTDRQCDAGCEYYRPKSTAYCKFPSSRHLSPVAAFPLHGAYNGQMAGAANLKPFSSSFRWTTMTTSAATKACCRMLQLGGF